MAVVLIMAINGIDAESGMSERIFILGEYCAIVSPSDMWCVFIFIIINIILYIIAVSLNLLLNMQEISSLLCIDTNNVKAFDVTNKSYTYILRYKVPPRKSARVYRTRIT